jgi:excisionase family DNA binding protein
MQNLLTMEEVAERLNTTPRHVRRLVSARRIAYRKLGRYVRFHPADVDEYIAANRVAVGGTVARTPPMSAAHARRQGRAGWATSKT